MWRFGAAALALGAIAILAVGFGFSGSGSTIPAGVTVGGVDVAGLTIEEALAELDGRSATVADDPIVLVADGKGVRLTPAQASLEVDWAGAVERALASGHGFGPLQGLKRLAIRATGRDVEPAAAVRRKVIREKLELLTAHLDDPAQDPALRLDGVEIVLEPGRAGNRIPVGRAITLVRDALVDPGAQSVELPVERVEADAAEARLALTRTRLESALSSPITVKLEDSTFRVSPERIAPMLRVRTGARGGVALSGPDAKAFFAELTSAVRRAPVDARFEVADDGSVQVVPHSTGRKLDIASSEAALLAALTGEERVATLAVKEVEPELTTEQAESYGIVDVVGTYTTSYGGEAGRKANVRLVSRLVDDHLISPGEVFSFNDTTGERNASKGFVEAPVIINGEVETALGGGVCQVSTTVYNAAYEAGLGIEKRVNHALYLDYYPTGRDATVNFPNIDMQFRNDTEHWLLLRVAVGEAELTVTLFGTPAGRRVVTKTSRLRATERPEIEQVPDAKLISGDKLVEKRGAPAREVSVQRVVYDANGDLLYDDRWDSSYLAEKRIVRVGTGAPPPAPEPAAEVEPVIPLPA
ncbi:MAG: VanW family protein [Gaiellaceae bacterium]